MKRKLMKHQTLYKFNGQTVLYFCHFPSPTYFLVTLVKVRVALSTTNFRKETFLAVSNQPITDMIEN